MGSWKTKLIFLLIVYFAGFATAIYCLAPVADPQVNQYCESEKGFLHSVLKSDEFAQSFNCQMHKCLDFTRDIAWRTGRLVKQKFDDEQSRTEG